MEENRLKPMPKDYDPKLFEELYSKTYHLKRKLASQISAERFGVDYKEVLSWFDVKFLYIFTKYHQDNKDILLGKLINGLKFFKCRILRKAYTKQFSQHIISFDALEYEPIHPEDNNLKEFYYTQLMEFLKAYLSDNAYCLFELKLNPTPFILNKLKELGINNIYKIPDEVIFEYFDIKSCPNAYKFIDNLEKEIKEGIKAAKIHFNQN